MPGPAPKSHAIRQRRNKSATKAVLPPEVSPRSRAPALPAERDWHSMTRKWWRDVWASPMATEYVRADEHALFRLAVLIDMFWTKPSKEIAAEIRLQQQAFGLTPSDRRRLEWSIEQAEQAKDRGEQREVRRSRRATVIEHEDPRALLK